MQYKGKKRASQDEISSQLTTREVCKLLRVGDGWLDKHRDEFEWYQIPGPGRNGLSYRFTRASVEKYIAERIRARQEAIDSSNPYHGKTVTEIAEIAKERVRRGLVSTSS